MASLDVIVTEMIKLVGDLAGPPASEDERLEITKLRQRARRLTEQMNERALAHLRSGRGD